MLKPRISIFTLTFFRLIQYMQMKVKLLSALSITFLLSPWRQTSVSTCNDTPIGYSCFINWHTVCVCVSRQGAPSVNRTMSTATEPSARTGTPYRLPQEGVRSTKVDQSDACHLLRHVYTLCSVHTNKTTPGCLLVNQGPVTATRQCNCTQTIFWLAIIVL
jgi:hypothetical protein